ncbi:MAG: hypothetical protein HY344_01085 [Candidatus Levybacteria bacterium]|nr:hypothetical protein [Candidatus Levybacteria bacterium]
MTVEIQRQGLDQFGQIDFTPQLVGQMEPGGRNMGIIHHRKDGKESGYVLVHAEREARIYRLTPGTFRTVWKGKHMLQLLVDERTVTDFPMRLFATLTQDRPQRCILVREEDGQKAFYRFRFR